MMRRAVIPCILSLIMNMTAGGSVFGNTKSDNVTVGSSVYVTQYLTLTYNQSTCPPGTTYEGRRTYQPTKATYHWFRSSTSDRFVYDMRLWAGSSGANCSSGFVWGNLYQPSYPYPTWASDRRFSITYTQNMTEPYLTDGGTFSQIGAYLTSRVESRAGSILGRPCSNTLLVQHGDPCP